MGGRASGFSAVALVMALLAAACTSGPGEPRSSGRPGDGAVTVGSFDFEESELLAELYSQALEDGGFEVRRAFNLGPREYVAPALAGGLVDLVPEYAGTAVQFLSLGAAAPGPDPGATHDAMAARLRTMSRARPFDVNVLMAQAVPSFRHAPTAVLMFDVDRARASQPRAELVDAVEAVEGCNGLRLRGGVACPGGT